jgi:hypothetical protein
MAMLDSVRPDLFRPLMLMGSPLSYWAGGSGLNPMRYSGATLGGAWLAALTADLGGDRFDGAHLVSNFENLNPANTWWSKYHRLWSQVDTEAERFLEFERWWGGFFRMTGAEIETIVENLFVGNKLARGEVMAGDALVDLRNITAPVVVFASWGDNITPPPQALNWIIDAWGDERAIAAAGRVIVYVLHENVGHLGIFVGADVARKEHDQIVNSLDVVENLPPGLYEMKLRSKDGLIALRWEDLEPGNYTVHYEHRTMDDLRAINPEGRDEEQLFSTVAKLSEVNTAAYKTWLRPWMQAMGQRPVADALGQLNPLRWTRQMFADGNPLASGIEAGARQVRENRHALPESHPSRAWEQALSTGIESSLNLYRDLRDQSVVQWTRMAFGPLGLGAWLPPGPTDEDRARARAEAELAGARREVLDTIGRGGVARAVCRLVLAGMVSVGSFERRSLRLARMLADLQAEHPGPHDHSIQWHELLRQEARIAAVAPVEALNALGDMLPDEASREQALAVAAAIMMIEPTLHNPRSEIIELVMGMLDVDPARVIGLARQLTAPVEERTLARRRAAAAPTRPTPATPKTLRAARRSAPVATAQPRRSA